MKQPILILLLLCQIPLWSQEVTFIKADQIRQWKAADNDTVYVINFWATWCAPCVEELPAFEKLNKKLASKKVKVILVSNDFKKAVDTKLKPFIKEKGLKCQVMFMNETNPDGWIQLVDPGWSGTIPATLILSKRKNKALFFENQLSYKQLKKAVRSVL